MLLVHPGRCVRQVERSSWSCVTKTKGEPSFFWKPRQFFHLIAWRNFRRRSAETFVEQQHFRLADAWPARGSRAGAGRPESWWASGSPPAERDEFAPPLSRASAISALRDFWHAASRSDVFPPRGGAGKRVL